MADAGVGACRRADRVPFLRSPPFPGIDPAVAAISQDDQGGFSAPISDGLLDALRLARVGGDFWGHRPKGLLLVAREGVRIDPSICVGLVAGQIGIMPADVSAKRGAPPAIGHWLPPVCDPWALLADARTVHAEVDDDLAIVAGLLGIAVFGPDGAAFSAEQLKDAARYRLASAHYRDCFSGEMVDAAHAVAQLADWRRHVDGNRGIAAASGMAFWKREAMRHFLWDGVRTPPFLPPARGLARARRRHFVASTTLFVLLALSITLIIDLDQPRSGLVTISQTPMSRTAESIRQMEGAKAVEQPPSDPSPN